MKKKLTANLVAAALCLATLTLDAQQAVGLYAGNHNAPYSAFQNPANTLPDLNRFYFNFWGANVGFSNNALTYSSPFGLIDWANGKYPDTYKSGGNLKMDQSWLPWNAAKNQKLYYLNEVYGPSVFFRATYRLGFGFGVRNVSGISVTGIDENLGKLLRYGLDSNSASFTGDNAITRGKKYSNGAFSLNADNYNEWFFSLAGATRNKGADFVKWGATAKLLAGTGSAHIGANSLDYTVNANNKVEISNTDLRYLHTSDESLINGISHPLGLNFNEYNGVGLGLDLGFVYENRARNQNVRNPNWWECTWDKQMVYNWKFGASITDLGFIGYNGSTRRLDESKTYNWTLNNQTLNNWNAAGQDRFARVDQGFFDDSSVKAGVGERYAVLTPAALNAQLDMNLGNNLYFGINWSQSLKSQNSLGLRKASYITFVPRWEGEHVEVGMPVTLTRDYTSLNLGLYGRVGPFIVGTDNIGGLAKFITNTPYKNANVYFGVRMQLPTCGWYHYETYDSIPKKDTITQNDTLKFWTRDTIRIVQRDTVFQTKIVRDTIVKTVTFNNQDLKKKEDELKAREIALAQKDAEIKKREAEVKRKENTQMGSTGDCGIKIAELEDQLKREKELYNKLNKQYQISEEERSRQEAKIRDLESQIAQLKKQNGDLNAENSNLRIQIENLKQEIARLKINNKPCDKQVKSLDSLLAIEQKKNADLNKELSTQKAKVYQQETELTAAKKRIAELEAELIAAKSSNNGSKECEDKVKALEVELAAEKTKTANLSKQLAQVQGEKEVLAKENSTLKAKVTGDEEEIARLKKQLEELRNEYNFELAENAKLREQLKKCGSSEEAEKLKAELEASNKKVTDLSTQLAKVSGEKDALEKENSSLKAKVLAQEKEISELKAKVDAQEKTIAELQEKLKNCGNAEELSKAKAELAAANAKIAELQDKVSDLSKAKALLETDLSAAKSKIADLEEQLKKCSGKNCDEIEAELNSLKGKYSVLKEEYDALLAERNKFKADLDKCKADLANCSGSSDEVDKLKAEVAKLKGTITELNGELAGKQKSLDELQSAYDKLEGQNGDLKQQIANLQGQIKGLNEKVADLEAKLKACQDAAGGGGN